MESKEYSWSWVISDEVVAHGPCELVSAYLVPSGATTDSALYDGENTSGKLITTLKSAVVTGHEFKPPVPVYCENGLFVHVDTSVTGIFVMWRNL